MFRTSFKSKHYRRNKFTAFEHQTVSLNTGTDSIWVTTVYNPSGIFSGDFDGEFSELLSDLQSSPGKHLILGDFNFHVNNASDTNAKKFETVLDQFNLKQNINVPTHIAGNTLDLVITSSDLCVHNLKTDHSINSDHFAVLFSIKSTSPGTVKKTVTYRNWKSVNIDQVKEDISSSFSGFTCTDPEEGVKSYNSILQGIVENHAPLKSREVTIRADAPWYNSELTKEKQLRRKLERKYKRTKLHVDKSQLDHQRNKYNYLLSEAKKNYFRSKVDNAQTSKELYSVCNKLLNRGKQSILPDYDCAETLANKFVDYFNDKIAKIRIDLEKSPLSTPDYLADINVVFDGDPLQEFALVSQDYVRKIISSSPTKSCSLDPIPTWLLKQCQEQIIPVLTLIVNSSLECASFPSELKKAFLTPLLKKAILDCEILKNYRPVSNLSFLSKLIERIVCIQLVDHLKRNDLYEVFQSAYRQLHSTETALLRVQNDLLQAVDTHGGAILVLLDLSAAFDTIDHDKLLSLLRSSFGVEDSALKWFESYLKDRTQTVQIGSSFSKGNTLSFGVPQGSVLGPILFTIYTTPLGHIIRKHGLTFHLYADDTQLYLAFKPSDNTSSDNAISRIESCVEDIKIWMRNNFLKLNEDKTELIVITSRETISDKLNIGLNIGGCNITPNKCAPRNLGVLFDTTCSLKSHVGKMCSNINYNLYSIGKIRKFLDKPTTVKMINATVTSRLDYCNSLLYGIHKSSISKLQRCQNHAARIISMLPKSSHITPILQDLHWLPVQQRIEYKMLLLTYKCVNGEAPSYLSNLLTPYVPARSLRSGDHHLLETPKWRLDRFGKRSFCNAAPALWNRLPTDIKLSPSADIFKRRLKTHLFKLAYK